MLVAHVNAVHMLLQIFLREKARRAHPALIPEKGGYPPFMCGRISVYKCELAYPQGLRSSKSPDSHVNPPDVVLKALIAGERLSAFLTGFLRLRLGVN